MKIAFISTFKGMTVRVTSSVREDGGKGRRVPGKVVKFSGGFCELDADTQFEEIKALANRPEFDRLYWPLHRAKFNEFAKAHKLPTVEEFRAEVGVIDSAATAEVVAQKDMKIKELEDKLDALQRVSGDSTEVKRGGKRTVKLPPVEKADEGKNPFSQE